MSDFRKVAHLEEQLGDERFQALISPDNTGKIREFCDNLVKPALLTEMTVGGVTYEILSFLKRGETSVRGDVMVSRSKELNANLGEEDCRNILKHQDEIPSVLRGKVYFIFTEERRPVDSEDVACVSWCGFCWVQDWIWLGYGWDGNDRVLRRK